MRSRCCSGPGRPSGDAEAFGRRVTSKAPLAHLVGGSGQAEASPTAILQDTHSLVSEFSETHTPLRKPLTPKPSDCWPGSPGVLEISSAGAGAGTNSKRASYRQC